MKFLANKKTITSLDVVKQINIFRQADATRNKKNLRHDTLLAIIRDEFSEEIGLRFLMETPYTHPQNGQTYPMFILTFNQAKQILLRESKIVRKAVIAYIEQLEKALTKEEDILSKGSLAQHLDTDVQKDFSKKVNTFNYERGGVTKTIEYNYRNCVIHTKKTPKEVKNIGKEKGLPSKNRTSAKEVIRVLKPEVACAMSFTDRLFTEHDELSHEEAADISINYAQDLFEKLLSIGKTVEELEQY
jgi:hypothetical protein